MKNFILICSIAIIIVFSIQLSAQRQHIELLDQEITDLKESGYKKGDFDVIPVEQIVDCWHGDQVATPNVEFNPGVVRAEQSYCLVIPDQAWEF